ncbi:MAG: hypothetical protein FWE40_07065, partial [Oscillospiraceae bacterium]|nr:hypothetical protein [Oscillospiraceae bacterium]
MKYKPTTTSAIAFAQAERLEEWLHLFLCNEGGNREFLDGLKLEPRIYAAPRLMDLNLFARCCGPEEDLKWTIPAAPFHANVDAIAKKYKTGKWDMPPLIINELDGRYELNDGNHRFEALRKL